MNIQTAEHAGTEVRRQYAAIRAGVQDGTPIAVLHIGADHTTVATGSGVEPDAVLVLAIGTRKTAVRYFRHDAPTADELENAITAVEDALMPLRAKNPVGWVLYTMDVGIREVAHAAGLPDQPNLKLHRDAVEQTFSRLAEVSHGRPASHGALPPGAAFPVTLLVLREFMHHVGFVTINVSC